MTRRYWLWRAQLCTGRELAGAGISRLRCTDLGRCRSIEQARRRAQEHLARGADEAVVIAGNVRRACDSGRGARFGLAAAQLARLREGEFLAFTDAAGSFRFGYSRFAD